MSYIILMDKFTQMLIIFYFLKIHDTALFLNHTHPNTKNGYIVHVFQKHIFVLNAKTFIAVWCDI